MRVAVKVARAYKIARVHKIARIYFCTKTRGIKLHEIKLHGDIFARFNFFLN